MSHKTWTKLLVAVGLTGTASPHENAKAEVVFRPAAIEIGNLPRGFGALAWTTGDLEGSGALDLVLGGSWRQDRNMYCGVLVLRRGDTRLQVVHRLLEQRTDEGMISDLSTCDLNNDGRDELFAVYGEKAMHRRVTWRDDEVVVSGTPFDGLTAPVVAWFDYNGDGWTDLFMIGNKPASSRPHAALVGLPGTLLRNDAGRLLRTDLIPDQVWWVDTAHVLDYDQDGRPDLLLGGPPGLVIQPNFNRVLLNRADGFVDLDRLWDCLDRLPGLGSMSMASGDLDGDGQDELILSGRGSRIGPKSFLAVAYRKKKVEGLATPCLSYDDQISLQIPDIFGELLLEDLDGDGDPDLLVFGFDRSFKPIIVALENVDGVLRRVGNGPWAVNPDQPLGEDYGWDGVVPWDIDDDGYLDVICFPRGGRGDVMALMNASRKRGEGKANPDDLGSRLPPHSRER